MKHDKFNKIYESVMGSIITEAYTYYSLVTVYESTRIITNDFTGPWVKGETGTKIMEHIHSMSANPDKQIDDYDTTLKIEKSISQIVCSYWEYRAKGGDPYANSTYSIFLEYRRKHKVDPKAASCKATEVGKVAYAIYAAMHSHLEKNKANTEQMDAMGIDDIFKVNSSVTLKLTVMDKFKQKNPYGYGSNYFIAGKTDEYPELKFILSETAKIKKMKIQDMPGCPIGRNGSLFSSDFYETEKDGLVAGDVITVSGNVKYVSKKSKSIYINKTEIMSVDSFVENKTNLVNFDKYKKIKKPLYRVQQMTDEERESLRHSTDVSKPLGLIVKTFESNPEKFKEFLTTAIARAEEETEDSTDNFNGIIAYDFKNTLNSPNFFDECMKIYKELYA